MQGRTLWCELVRLVAAKLVVARRSCFRWGKKAYTNFGKFMYS